MSSTQPAKVLLVDDDPLGLDGLNILFDNDYELLSAHSGRDAIAHAEKHSDIAVVVMDIKMEGMDGITAARQIKAILPQVAIIFHTGYPGDFEERAIDAKEKPFDYVDKGCSAVRLRRAVRNGVEAYRLKTTGRFEANGDHPNFGLVGKSQAILQVIREITKVAPSDNKVMILGETGTGKELVAKALHNESMRRHKPLAILHCNHKSPDLVETELFGHKRGAFTTAISDREGLFEYGDGGTVFLDEIGDLDITTQAKLLRVLESGEYSRIGDPELKRTNVRLLCATHKDLDAMVKKGSFREDLYYRLKGVQICLPPLRERREDIPILVEHFTREFCSAHDFQLKLFDQPAVDLLARQDWPGNVRQLLDTVESVLVLTDSDLIGVDDLQRYFGSHQRDGIANGEMDGLAGKVESYKRTLVLQALRQSDGNLSAAAALLKVDRSNLRRYLLEQHLESQG